MAMTPPRPVRGSSAARARQPRCAGPAVAPPAASGTRLGRPAPGPLGKDQARPTERPAVRWRWADVSTDAMHPLPTRRQRTRPGPWAAAWWSGSVTLLVRTLPASGSPPCSFQVPPRRWRPPVGSTSCLRLGRGVASPRSPVVSGPRRIGLVPLSPSWPLRVPTSRRSRPWSSATDPRLLSWSIAAIGLGTPSWDSLAGRPGPGAYPCVERLTRMAKLTGASALAGGPRDQGRRPGRSPRAVEHLVDTVLSFDGDRHHASGVLTSVKHRFGPAGEVGIFEMRDDGLRARARSRSVAARRPDGRRPRFGGGTRAAGPPSPPGGGAGALSAPAPVAAWGPPRPQTLGIDVARANLLLAVLACRTCGPNPGLGLRCSPPPWAASRSPSGRPTWPWALAMARSHRHGLCRPMCRLRRAGPGRRAPHRPGRRPAPGRGPPGRVHPGPGARLHGRCAG